MKLPVCEICAYTNNLCKKCKDRLRAGEIGKLDVELSRIMYSLAKHKNMENVMIKRTIKVNGLVLIVVGNNPGVLIGKRGRTIKRISQELGYKVRVINDKRGDRDKLSDLFWPIPLLGVNEVFSSNGEYVKIRLPRSYARRLPFELSVLQQGATKLLGKRAEIVFE